MNYRFCPACATPLIKGVVPGDHLERTKCPSCSFVHYESPRILVSALATYGDKLLWIRRGTEPCKGLWAQPGGFMEKGEQPEQAVLRELEEETQVRLIESSLELFAIGSLPMMNQVYLVYRGEMRDAKLGSSEEAPEVRLFAEDEAPWQNCAYPDLETVTRHFYRDHHKATYGVYCCVYKDGVNYYRDTVRSYIPKELQHYL